ncbi:hypothetical protein ROA7450_00497 [Roseovarius albus]|uniref:Lipoprotein n=1 Tax=Roseovarius albus TaxID=1247867 RepID=A0A1X6YCH8_9RHOB|nr:hypothetical protein [Roseovarius albus]SLN16931.1 hypothetical protein ROA7450_00497 [Roseovarius albus]
MRILLCGVLLSSIALAGCGGKSKTTSVQTSGTSSVNPLINPDKKSDLQPAKNTSTVQRSGLFKKKIKVIPYQGIPVAQIKSVEVNDTAGGAILLATGLPTQQGSFDVRLIRTNAEPGVLHYTLNAVQPATTPQGTQRSREIQAALFLSNQDLQGINTIRVSGTANSVRARR